MVENPLFYQSIVALNREAHKELKVDVSDSRFGFAAGAHMVPAVVDEFLAGGRVMPIVFVPGVARATPVFLVGLRPGENCFVEKDGRWIADYVPAFLRRYPFIIGEAANVEPVVCIDTKSSLLKKDQGEDLFLSDGEQAPLLKSTVQFINDYRLAAARTDAFVDNLQKLDLFRTITVNVRLPDSSTQTLHGTMTIDLAKLEQLPDSEFLGLRSSGDLVLIYAHAMSLTGMDKLAKPSNQTAPN